jgi:hypothetical protein
MFYVAATSHQIIAQYDRLPETLPATALAPLCADGLPCNIDDEKPSLNICASCTGLLLNIVDHFVFICGPKPAGV